MPRDYSVTLNCIKVTGWSLDDKGANLTATYGVGVCTEVPIIVDGAQTGTEQHFVEHAYAANGNGTSTVTIGDADTRDAMVAKAVGQACMIEGINPQAGDVILLP